MDTKKEIVLAAIKNITHLQTVTGNKQIMIMNSGYYPLGAADDPRAPYNQTDPPEIDFDVCISQTLSRNTTVSTDEYYQYEDTIDTSDVSWEKVYESQHLTPLELILCCERLAETMLTDGKKNLQIPGIGNVSMKYIMDNCKGWIEDEIEVVQE